MKTSPIINEQKQVNNRKKVVAASVAGSALGIATSVAGLYAMAKKGNPALALKNLAYQEKDVLLIGASSILGGLAGGLIADNDKENITIIVNPKLVDNITSVSESFKEEISKIQSIKILEDNSVSPDGVIVETLSTRLDSRISTQISEIAQKMLTGTNDELEQG